MQIVKIGRTRVFRWEATGHTTKSRHSKLDLIQLGVAVFGLIWLALILAGRYPFWRIVLGEL